MQRTHLLAVAATALTLGLGACNQQPEAINEYDPQAAALRNAQPVELPPAITSSRTFRCAPDNSLYFVDYYNNGTATIRTSQGGTPTMLTGTNNAPPFTGEGYSVSANGTHITINGKACHT